MREYNYFCPSCGKVYSQEVAKYNNFECSGCNDRLRKRK